MEFYINDSFARQEEQRATRRSRQQQLDVARRWLYRGDSKWPSPQVVVLEPVMVEGKKEYYVERIIRRRDVLLRGRARKGEPKEKTGDAFYRLPCHWFTEDPKGNLRQRPWMWPLKPYLH